MEKYIKIVHEYWSKTELGRKMIKSDNVSDLDLLFLIPNNVKKRYGLPLTRISGKKKRKQKHQRKRFIMSFQCFDIIENIIEEHLTSAWSNSEFFGEFVETKKCNLGDKNYQELSDYKGVKNNVSELL